MTPKIRLFVIVIFVCNFQLITAQTTEIHGEVKSTVGLENIHVINKTANLFTITDKIGKFKIRAKINDSIIFTSVQHKTEIIVVNQSIIASKIFIVALQEQVNELDEVIVGKVLTGDLFSDMDNVQGKPPINFYDVGIPGYTGKIATQSERRLSEAGEFKPQMLLGLLTGGIPLNPILNGISGRTKMLKQRVALESKTELMFRIKARLSENFFASNPLEDSLKMDFFYFCSDDDKFIQTCKGQSDFQILLFLKKKYNEYLMNSKDAKD
jgi:hypothetical protein